MGKKAQGHGKAKKTHNFNKQMSEKIQSSSDVLDCLFPVNMEIISVNKKAPKKKIIE